MNLYDVGMASGEPKLKPHKKIASVAVFNGDAILMGIRRDNSKLTLPGGGMEKGETPEEAAERELFEEAGIKTGRLEPLGCEAVQVSGGRIVMVHAFKCLSNAVPTSFYDPDEEVKEWFWVPVGDGGLNPVILENLHSPQNVVLKKLGLQEFDTLDIQEHVEKAHSVVGPKGHKPPVESLNLEEGMWYKGKINDSETPFGNGYEIGETVYVRTWKEKALVCFGSNQIRFVTAQQVFDHIDIEFEEPDDDQNAIEILYRQLRMRMLASPNGRLVPIPPLEQGYPLPYGVPSKYRGFTVLMVDQTPVVQGKLWFAVWMYDGVNKYIFFQRAILEMLIAADWHDEIRITFEHEHNEAVDARELARGEYPEATEAQLDAFAEHFGGLAHMSTLEIVDGFYDESQYNDALAQRLEKIGALKKLGLDHKEMASSKDIKVLVEEGNELPEAVKRKSGFVIDLKKAAGYVKPGHKYIRRTGSSGNYSYIYRPEGGGKPVFMSSPIADAFVNSDKYLRVGGLTGIETYDRQMHYLKDLGGVKDISFTTSMSPEMKVIHLRGVSEGLKDMIDVLSLPTNMVSYNGRLSIKINAIRQGSVRASYHPIYTEITVDQSRGVGSVAHEWGHFLDNILYRVLSHNEAGKATTGAGFLSSATRENGEFVTHGGLVMKQGRNAEEYESVRHAMAELMKAFESTHRKRLREHPEFARFPRKFQQYYLTPTETFARGFERYVIDRLHSQSSDNRYLVGLAKMDWRWPTSEEVGVAYDRLFDALREGHLLQKAIAKIPSIKMALV